MAESDFIAVSLKGDKEYIDGLRLLAMSRRTTIGDLVREACDKVWADAITDARLRAESFFADSGTSENRLERRRTNKRSEPTR